VQQSHQRIQKLKDLEVDFAGDGFLDVLSAKMAQKIRTSLRLSSRFPTIKGVSTLRSKPSCVYLLGISWGNPGYRRKAP
jgi:hypothetical protein